ncbi:MATE efflux family protein [Abeliophyllum distichum]|uniref:MATE efflux family protein n=1 Tax=Abeliophyllum distichum TaxID=126358 RepID=A0ABD1SEX8_9LAMI
MDGGVEPLLGDHHHHHQNEEEKGFVDGKQSSFVKEFGVESKKLWKLAGPAIFTSICQYSLGALTQTFSGFIGEMELAAVSVENSVVAGLAFGVMLGMGSALETLCGQAYGAGEKRMLGIYMQRSWVILVITACILLPIYIFSPPILEFFGETAQISRAAGKFAIWMIPQLFAYALNFPIQKFLQAQRKLLEFWYIMVVVVIAGRLDNPLIPVDAISICMNIEGWEAMISIGFNAAISVRVSNELGAGNARAAKFSVIVVSITSMLIGVVCMAVVLSTRDYFPYLFTNSDAVAKEVTRLAILLGLTVLLNSLQPVLSGVAVGAWMAVSRSMDQYCLLLHCWNACRYTARLHI